MSDRRAAVVAALLAAGTAVGAASDPQALLRRAERGRNAFAEGVVTIRVTVTGPERAGTARFEVAVKGRRSRVKFLERDDTGKFIVFSPGEAWLLLPTARQPIRIPPSQRVRGGLPVAEISQLGFSDDYDAVVEREDDLGGRKCAVLRLAAHKGAAVSSPVVRVWIDAEEGLYRRAVFLLASGRTARDVSFDAWRYEKGSPFLERMTITDALRPGTTVVEYTDYERRPVPDAWLDPRTARGE